MENSIKCRKCGGKHLTIKCGKDNSINDKKINNYERDKKFNNYEGKRKFNKVKISNLPYDITLEEMTELLENWGHIIKVYVKNFNENSFAIIEFKFKDELDYFIKALNKTPFENLIIGVVELDNY